MSEKKIYLADLHFHHNLWINELKFWEEELVIFTKRLEEVITKWTDTDVKAHLEHFQNQFIRHKEVIDILKHDIRTFEKQLATYAEEHPIAIDHVYFKDHTSLRESMETQQNLFNQLKKEFYEYIKTVL